jgi:hypothetical protein
LQGKVEGSRVITDHAQQQLSPILFMKKVELENGEKSSSISSFCYLPML